MSNDVSILTANILKALSHITQVEMTNGRKPGSVCLVAISKTKPLWMLEHAYALGLRHFGENYVQEAVEKIDALAELADISWHFVGALQSNKSQLVADRFAWVHTIDRVKIAQRLSQQRPAHMPALNVLIQINISDETTKGGILLKDLHHFAEKIIDLPNLCVRGLMAIPDKSLSQQETEDSYCLMQNSLTSLRQQFENHPKCHHLDSLSMGMSEDFPIAIGQGATMIRLGTTLFGAREKK